VEKLSKMPNIGGTLEKKLMEAGINTPEDLKKAGSKEAFIKIKFIDNTACYNMLCALEGAIQGIRWHDLSEDTKKDLKLFFSMENLKRDK